MSSELPSLPLVQSRTEVVTGVIREAILSQRMRPGETLVERRIAEDLGVSKTPVREALIILQQTGLVTVGSNRRLTVASLTTDDVTHIYEMRALLEVWALRHAELDEETVGQAEEALENARKAWESDNQPEQVLSNRAFHRTLYSTCGNSYVVRSLDALQDMTALAITTVLWEKGPGDAITEHEQHQHILRTAANGDLEKAAVLLGEHICSSIAGKTASEIRFQASL